MRVFYRDSHSDGPWTEGTITMMDGLTTLVVETKTDKGYRVDYRLRHFEMATHEVDGAFVFTGFQAMSDEPHYDYKIRGVSIRMTKPRAKKSE